MANADQTPEGIWKFQERENEKIQVELTTDDLCAMARSRERRNEFVKWSVVIVAMALAAAFL
jgi:hypothetical protein